MSDPAEVEVRTLTRPGPELTALVPEWEELAAWSGSGLAGRPGYGLSWWQAIGRGRLNVVTARRNGRLVAVAPLHRRRVLGRPVLRWLGHGLGAVGELVTADEAAATAVWDELARQGAPLQLVPSRLDDAGTLALRRSGRWQLQLVVTEPCPVLELPAGCRARDIRGPQSLARLAGYRRALERAEQPFGTELVTDVTGLQRRWPDLVRIAAAASGRRSDRDLCAPPHDRFTRGFLEAEAEAGRLLLLGATVGGHWAAFQVLLRRSGTTLELWMLRVDPAWGRFGLGHQLTEQVVDRHDELVFDRLDLGTGESSFTSAWARDGYDVAAVTAAPRRIGLVEARLVLSGMASRPGGGGR